MSENNRLAFSSQRKQKLTHYAFRYPAKFHVPVVRTLIKRYTNKGYTCLDPFSGSGTLLIEAATHGRHAIGLDVDPLAVFVSKVKISRISPQRLEFTAGLLLNEIQKRLKADKDIGLFLTEDISDSEYLKRLNQEGLDPPPIPNLHHWFRRSVIIQLSRIRSIIAGSAIDGDVKNFYLLCFASIVRKCSNADPIPVSGLEVTSYMRKMEERGRTIDVFKEFERVVVRSIVGACEYYLNTSHSTSVRVEIQDARNLSGTTYNAEAVITSPPYHSAVDYYRRHQLECYWLGLVKDHNERQRLIPRYIGRAGVAKKNLPQNCQPMGDLGSYWESRIRERNARRADDFIHYYYGMCDFFKGVSELIPQNTPVVIVVGNNKVHGEVLPVVEMFDEMSSDKFEFVESFWYPVKNRYMSYKRRNGANIDREFVLAFQKT